MLKRKFLAILIFLIIATCAISAVNAEEISHNSEIINEDISIDEITTEEQQEEVQSIEDTSEELGEDTSTDYVTEIENKNTQEIQSIDKTTDTADEKLTQEITNDNEILKEKDNGTFTALQDKIDAAAAGSTISLENDYKYDSGFSTEGIKIDKSITINGNGHKLDGLSKSTIFNINDDAEYYAISVSLKNIKFVNGKGAIYASFYLYENNLTIENCVFTSNKDSALKVCHGSLKVKNSNFTNNQAKEGGAIYVWDGQTSTRVYSSKVTIEKCNFNSNKATSLGGAIYNYDSGFYVKNCVFKSNSAKNGGAIYTAGFASVENSVFTSNQASQSGGALYLQPYAANEYRGWSSSASTSHYYNLVKSSTFTGNRAKKSSAIFVGQERYDNPEDVDVKKCTFNNKKANDGKVVNGAKVISCLFKQTALSASKVTTSYKVSKKLVVTLKDAGGFALKSKKVKIRVGTISKTLTTNGKGKVSIDISKLAPKKYTAKITFAGDKTHSKSSKSVKVTVKKLNPKMTSKQKTFKAKAKAKKYTTTLKNKKGKAIKNAKVYLKLITQKVRSFYVTNDVVKVNNKKTFKAKTYKATTNKKGKATFRIKGLSKKGFYFAVLQFKGNKYYKPINREVYITVI